MKKYLYLFLFSIVQLHAQSLYVEYEHTVNVVKETNSFKMNAFLVAEANLSHYTIFFNNDKFKNISKVVKDENEGSSFRLFTSVDVGDSSTLIYNKIDNTISQSFLDRGKPTIITDNGVNFDWQITEETRIIQNFNSTKAVVDFRGRTFVAWFATDIPVAFGPWKFHGLPGLILEVYDVDDLFSWRATLIQYPIELDKELETISDKKNSRIITLKTYLEEQVELRREKDRILNSKLPKGSRIVESKTENKSIELVYEWELDKDKKD